MQNLTRYCKLIFNYMQTVGDIKYKPGFSDSHSRVYPVYYFRKMHWILQQKQLLHVQKQVIRDYRQG